MQPYVFDQDDMMQPIYCIQCRSHIPRIVSNLGKGLCPICIAHNVHISLQAPASPPTPVVVIQGPTCPNCGSSSVSDYSHQVRNDTRASMSAVGGLLIFLGVLGICFGGLILAFIGFLIFIVAICLPAKNTVGFGRRCAGCGHSWSI